MADFGALRRRCRDRFSGDCKSFIVAMDLPEAAICQALRGLAPERDVCIIAALQE
jgi:hypothetical protein